MTKMFLNISDYSKNELLQMISLAQKIKANPSKYKDALVGKTLGLIFEKPSTRTRVSFEIAIHQMGGSAHFLSGREMQLGAREEMKDIARTLSRYLDVLVLRTFSHATIEAFSEHATIPVVNGLSDLSHPCQALADYLTLSEKFKDPTKITVAYIGDGNNVLISLMELLTKLGVSLHYATPEGYEPDPNSVATCMQEAEESGAILKHFKTAEEAVKEADVIYTDVFVSMGEEEKRDDKLKAFNGFQINGELLSACDKEPLVMHCLPAHRGEEITDEVIESDQSIVFDQAENRLHAQKAILHFLMKG